MALLDTVNDKFCLYRYKVNHVHIIFPDQIVTLESHRVESLVIQDNYVDNMYPVISLRLSVEDSLHNKIIENKGEVKFQIDMRKFYTLKKNGEESIPMAHINRTFHLILDETANTVNSDVVKAEFPEGDTNELQGVTRIEEFYLFDSDIIRANTAIINAVLKEATPTAAISMILKASGLRKNLIMPVAHNITIYPELVIPPLRIGKALGFVESYYGVYRSGSIIYFGTDRNYFIPYCTRCAALAPSEQEIVNIIVPQTGSSLTDSPCGVSRASEPNTPYLVADNASFEPSDHNVTNTILYPNELEVMENETGSKSSAASDKNKKVKLNPTENPFYKTSYDLRKLATSAVISLSVKNCDLSIFTPNKIYQILFEDTKLMKLYHGFYHLVKSDVAYVKQSDEFEGGADLMFHKNIG